MANTDETGTMTTQDTLLAYSEWLDSEGLVKSDQGKDKRSHDELAQAFIEHWESNEDRATLAGRVGAKFVAMLSKALHDAANSLSQ